MKREEYAKMTVAEMMDTFFQNAEIITASWEKIKGGKRNALAGKRIRKAFDEIGKMKMELRPAMLKKERA